MKTLTTDILSNVIHPRPKESHKGNYGRVALIGGIEPYGGAILMSGLACVASGAGLTTIVTESQNQAAIHSRLPEAMVVDWHHQDVLAIIENSQVILIGPGLGLSPDSRQLLQQVILHQRPKQWLIIDGSAITLFAEENFTLQYPEHVVFTPHEMEWQRLSGIPLAEQTNEASAAFQKEIKSICVVKSHATKIFATTASYLNPLGNPAMATGGTGDALAGMIAAFLAQFAKTPETIAAAVYLHSYLADELAQTRYVVLPTEISQNISPAMKKFSEY